MTAHPSGGETFALDESAPEESALDESSSGGPAVFSLPASLNQQAPWFHEELEPGSPLYNIYLATELLGTLDAQALGESLNEVIQRHESLRTSFKATHEGPAQVIAERLRVRIPSVDLEGIPGPRRLAAALENAGQDYQQPFDLSQGTQLRAILFRLDEKRHLLYFVFHHIIVDHWSFDIFCRELSQFYRAYKTRTPLSLPLPPLQYADYSQWQAAKLAGKKLAGELDFWRDQLHGAPACLDLQIGRARPPVQSYRGTVHHVELERSLVQVLKQLSQRCGVTPFMALLGAFTALLTRSSGRQDIVVGTFTANRGRSELEDIIGNFANTVALRVDTSGAPTFEQLLTRVRDVAIHAYTHQEVPFQKVVDAVQPERSLGWNPLFQFAFDLHEALGYVVQLDGLTSTPTQIHEVTAKVDISLSLAESDLGMTGELTFSTDLFDPVDMRRLWRHYRTLLTTALKEPDLRLPQLPLLDAQTRRQLLVDWNDTEIQHREETCFHRLFETQAALRPHATAVECGQRQLSYAELNRQTNRLGRYLGTLGVGPEVRVGLSIERSLEWVIGWLGILKAGGVAVALDPTLPAERLHNMIQDAAPTILLTQSGVRDRLPTDQGAVVCLEQISTALSQLPGENPDVPLSPDNSVYILFTSGSTGRPKGVMTTHGGLCNLAQSQLARLGVTSEDRVLQFASIGFDVAASEICMALGSGAKLVIAGQQVVKIGEELEHFLRQRAVTVATLPPTMLRLLSPREHRLRILLCGGEEVPQDLVQSWARGIDFYNVLGPTEVTVYATMGSCHAEDLAAPPIGTPIGNVRAYLVDRWLEPVDLATTGELLVAGRGLARGYVGRPAMTAARYLPNPFAEAPGERIYRSGDLARYRPNRDIEFHGRLDQQVQIRGFRVELGEIETTMQSHPAVEQAIAVLETPDSASHSPQRLVVHLTTSQEVSDTALYEFLGARLPSYMMPASFERLESLPLNASGKVDRRLLASSPRRPSTAQASPLDAGTPAEEIVRSIWAEVLELDEVSADDDFFKLGGHSVLATMAVSRIREALSIELPVRHLFQAPTVAAFSKLLESFLDSATTAAAPGGLGTSGGDPRTEMVDPLRGAEGFYTNDGLVNAPLSLAQERLWFLEQYEPTAGIYVVPSAWRLQGALDVQLLEQGLNRVAARQQALRATFKMEDGVPRQQIHPRTSLTITLVDLQSLPPELRRAQAHRRMVEEAHLSFHLELGPLLRATVLRLAGDEYIFLLTLHHIISDAWSLRILFEELAAYYAAGVGGGPPVELPELAFQYTDFIAWEHRQFSDEMADDDLSYWQDQLRGAAAHLDLPTDRPRPTHQSHGGRVEAFRLENDLAEGLTALGRHRGATTFMSLQAAFSILLARYSGQKDIVVGTPVSNRTHTAMEPLIGCFVNTVVLRTNLSEDPTFAELLPQIRRVVLEAQAHQQLPFERLVQALEPQRDLSRHPLFQVMFAFQQGPGDAPTLPGLSVRPLSPVYDITAFDLTLYIDATPQGFEGSFEYNTALFDAATVRRMTKSWRNLLRSIVLDPETPMSQLDLLSSVARRQLLVDWNDTEVRHAEGTCFHFLFERLALQRPEALAVDFGRVQLSYGALNRRANQLARYLRSRGVGPDVCVGLSVERSAQLIFGVLGILKAGGAYVALDPVQPSQRLAAVVQDAAPAVLLTQSAMRGRLPPGEARVVCIDLLDTDLSHLREDDLSTALSPENLAYILYTSGSTGRPKGVMVPHRGLCNLAQSQLARIAVKSSDKVLQFASLGFDASIWEICMALGSGAALALAEQRVVENSEELAALIRQRRVTAATLPPPMLRLLSPEDLPLKHLVSAGEECSTQLVHTWASAETTFYNAYGPTESSVCATITRCSKQESTPPSIGTPIGNIRTYVVDSWLQPVEIRTGELLLAGRGLARGYVGLPRETATHFLPDPFSTTPGSRVYRTGDLARHRSNGDLEFHGRCDRQVKIRGARVELGEIEAALSAHPKVEHGVLVVREDATVERTLLAYVVPAGPQLPTPSELREDLQKLLPRYMVPTTFLVVESLPVNRHGKIDRSVLPAAPAPLSNAAQTAEAPRTPTEELLAGIWSRLLSIPRIGPQDDFFILGGHSLLATQVIAHVAAAFGVELTVRSVFDATTLGEFAAEIDRAMEADREHPPLPPIGRRPPQTAASLSFAQQRLWFLSQLEADSAAYNLPIAFEVNGPLHPGILQRCLREIVRRHEVLRTNFVTVEGQPQQVVAHPRTLSMPRVDLTGLPEPRRGHELNARLRETDALPFDLAEEPLFRANLFRLGQEHHFLSLNLHHIVTDGWSMHIFTEELTRLYGAYNSGSPSPLPELPIQYADFAVWQRQWLRGEILETQLAYWRQQLDDAPPWALLADYPRQQMQTFTGASHSARLSPHLTAALRSVALDEQVTLFMILLAAFKVVLFRHTGQGDLCIGCPVANRNHLETEELIGFFVNTLVMRTRLASTMSFRELLAQVRETTLEGYGHQDIPFQKLVEELQPERDLSRTPLFQVLFNMQNFNHRAAAPSGLSLKALESPLEQSKFDLTLYAEEQGECIQLDLVYNEALFEGGRMGEILAQLAVLLEQVAARPEQQIGQLSLLTSSAAAHLPDPYGELAGEWPGSIARRMLEHAAEEPERIAVLDDYGSWSYGDLARRSGQIASWLLSEGVGEEDVVALCGKKGGALVTAMLGVFRAGAAFSLLDAGDPSARLEVRLRTCRPSALIEVGNSGALSVELRRIAGEFAGDRLLLLPESVGGSPHDPVAGYSPQPPDQETAPDSLAYIAFTSGSTGKPKAILGTHRPLAHFLAWYAQRFDLNTRDRFAMLSPLGHDPFLRDVFAPLWVGAVACVPPDGTLDSANRLVHWLADAELTAIHLAPAMARVLRESSAFQEHPPQSKLNRLRYVFFGSDVVTRSDVTTLRALAPSVTCVNLYGTTETPQAAGYYVIDQERLRASQPIGMGIDGTRLLVLQDGDRRAGVGEIGEIGVRSPYLARGYLQDETLTRERFVTNPFSGNPADRVYRTGDLGFYLADGNLQFVGRKDNQVSIRGYRVELEEIEAALLEDASIEEAAVVLVGARSTEPYLVALIVASHPPSTLALRKALRKRLPSFMIPQSIQTLEELPRTATGKLQRKRLPTLVRRIESEVRSHVPPVSPTERLVADIWKEELGISQIGRHDNFLDLGGHSLQLFKVIAKIENQLGVNIRLRDLFLQDLGQLAASCDATAS